MRFIFKPLEKGTGGPQGPAGSKDYGLPNVTLALAAIEVAAWPREPMPVLAAMVSAKPAAAGSGTA